MKVRVLKHRPVVSPFIQYLGTGKRRPHRVALSRVQTVRVRRSGLK